MNELSCAVVIVCHNYGRFLAQAIESVLAQSRPATEIVVILDHCSDNSHEVAARYPVQRIVAETCDCHLSRRLGMRATISEVLIFLDADDWLSANSIEAGLAAFADPEVGIVTGSAEVFGDIVETWTPDGEDDWATSAALCRRKSLEETEVMEDLSLVGVYAQDWFMFRRLIAAGWKVATAQIVHHHRRHEGAAGASRRAPDNAQRRLLRRATGWHDRSLRIGFLGGCLALGGVERLTLAQIHYARHLFWSACWLPDGAPWRDETVERMPPLYQGPDLGGFLTNCDVVYAWGGPLEAIREVCARGVPVVYGVHGHGTWWRRNAAAAAGVVDVIWCISMAVMNCVPPSHRNKVRLIRGGADLRAVVATNDRETIRRNWGIAPGQLAVGYVGRLSGEKNPAVIAPAVARVPGATLVVCSPHFANRANPIHRRIAKALPDRVVWTSSTYQPMGEVFRGLDCLVVASHEEAIPLVTLEAWAAGVPVVSTPVGLVPELEQRHGRLVERVPIDPRAEQVARAIKRTIGTSSERRERARELVLAEFGAQRMTVEFEEMVQRVVMDSRKQTLPTSRTGSPPAPTFGSRQPPHHTERGYELLDGAPQRIDAPHDSAAAGRARSRASTTAAAGKHSRRRPPTVTIKSLEIPPGPRRHYTCDVVIPYYRNLQWVPEAIDSILRQRSVSTRLHLINDDSPEEDGWLKQRYARHRNVRWYRNLKNLGPYRSLHQVWHRVRTPFLAIQDSDDISYSNRLWHSIDTLEREGGDMFGAGMEVFLEPDDRMIREVDRKFADRYPVWPSGQRWRTCPNGFLVNGTLVMRRSLFERLNGYHNLICGGDVEFCTRAFHAGAKQITSGAVVGARRITNRSLSRGGEYAMGQPKRQAIVHRISALYEQFERPDFDPTRYGCLDRADPALTVSASPESPW